MSGPTPATASLRMNAEGASVRVVVVVVAYHADRWLPECVRTLGAGWNARDRLLLVDNSGNTVVESAAREIAGARVVSTPRPMGFAEANNYGLVHGGLAGEYVCFLNQDTISEPGWLDACVACLESRPDVGGVLPLLRTYDDSDWDAGFRSCVSANQEFAEDAASGRFQEFYEAAQVSAAALVVRTSALVKVGPFDPIFGSYYEDYDLCRRLRGAGHRVGVCGRGTVRHFDGSSTTTTEAQQRRMRQIIRNRAIHRIRSSRHRLGLVVDQFVRELPWNAARGLARTASSQPVGAQLAAHLDLMRIIDRLLFEVRDRRAWSDYLKSIGWPGSAGELVGGFGRSSTSESAA